MGATTSWPAWCLGALLLLAPALAAAQPSRIGYIEQGGGYRAFTVNGEPFLPFGGWQGVGIQPCVAAGFYHAQPCWDWDVQQGGTRIYFQNGRAQALRDLDAIAASGGTITYGVLDYFGRILAPGVALSESNPNLVWWNEVSAVTGASGSNEGRGFKGYKKPGAYVEAARWLIREAYARGIYTVLDVSTFISPTHRKGLPPDASPDPGNYRAWPATYVVADGTPYHGYQQISCRAFRALIATERYVHSEANASGSGSGQFGFALEAMPAVDCTADATPDVDLPLWEWNLWYVVSNLKDEPGLFGWHLWDEPEGARRANAEMFGDPEAQFTRDGCAARSEVAWTQGMRVDPYNVDPNTGERYLGTPNLLHYAYDLIKKWDTAPSAHPVVIDISSPWAFVTLRSANGGTTEDWASTSRWMCGPFDRDPRQDTPSYRFPADIILLEGGEHFGFMEEKEGWGMTFPEWDAGTPALHAAQIQRLVADSEALYGRPLWGSIYLGRADVADRPCPDKEVDDQGRCVSSGGFAFTDETGAVRRTTEFRLRQPGNDAARARPLTDRDIVFQGLAPLITGTAGMWWYGLRYMPLESDPDNPVYTGFQRVNRFTEQFLAQDLDRVLLQPREPTYAVTRVDVLALTAYVRDSPTQSEPYGSYDHESRYPNRGPILDADYTRRAFGRHDPRGVACASVAPNAVWGQAMAGDVGGRDRNQCGYREYPAYEHLRTSYHAYEGDHYLFVSNAFDANIRATFALDTPGSGAPPTSEMLRFRLDRDTAVWEGTGALRCDGAACTFSAALGPYETRVYRIRK